MKCDLEVQQEQQVTRHGFAAGRKRKLVQSINLGMIKLIFWCSCNKDKTISLKE